MEKKMNYYQINLNTFGDERGHLVACEENCNIPFDIKRCFYIFDTKESISRGMHANRDSQFLLIPLSGSCRVKVDDGKNKADFLLNNPHQGLYLNRMVWKEMYEFSYNAVLLVLSDQKYNEAEYIRNYNEFLKESRHG